MKIKIVEGNLAPYYRLEGGLGQKGHKIVDIGSNLANELIKFQKLVDEVQFLIKAYYEGRHESESDIKLAVERLNATHNSRIR